MRWPRSLQGRLLGPLLGLLSVVWLGAAAMTWFDVRHTLDELLDSHLAQAAALLVVQQAPGFDDDEDHAVDVPNPWRYAPQVAFQVFHEGRLTLRSANAPMRPMAAPGRGFRSVRFDGSDWRVFATAGAERDVQVFVGEQVASRASILQAVLRSTLQPLVVALPLLALVGWWAVAGGLHPLHRLGRTLAERQPQALESVAIADAPTEMQPMVDALNGLFRRIGALMEAERRFTADAAHELRTPIAAIRAQAQVALGEADADARSHALRATLVGCDRATRLIDQMLTLSRLEAGAAPALAPLDLAALLRLELAELAPQALAKGQTLELVAESPCIVRGDTTLLAVLLRNLADNAIRYAPHGGSVKLTLEPRADGPRLWVENSGPGLSDTDRQRLGERFFRVLGSGQSGSGLGWSIVRRIGDLHGARIEVGQSTALGGLRVTVDWPAPRPMLADTQQPV